MIALRKNIKNISQKEGMNVCPFFIVHILPEYRSDVSVLHFMRLLFIMECIFQNEMDKGLFDEEFRLTQNGIEAAGFRELTQPFCKSMATIINRSNLSTISRLQAVYDMPENFDPIALKFIRNTLEKLKKYSSCDLVIITQTSNTYRKLHDPDVEYVLSPEHFKAFARDWIKDNKL